MNTPSFYLGIDVGTGNVRAGIFWGFIIAALLALQGICSGAENDATPVIPVGLDAYRMWDHWPAQRIGARAFMRSTYDRAGKNQSADASHFLYMEKEDFNVALDVEGAGILYFVRTNHWHGSPWHYVVDGTDHVVRETGTLDPVKARTTLERAVMMPEALFPEPLALTWTTTKGADLMWVPMTFEKSLRLAYSRTRYGTGYYIFHQYLRDANLSRPLTAWDGRTPPDPSVLDLISRSGTDIAPIDIETRQGELTVGRDGSQLITQLESAPATVRALKLTLPLDQAVELGKLRLRITWDDMSQPSIDAPLSLFFGAGTLYNRDQREFLVKAFPVNIRFDYERKEVVLGCYFPMPFFKSARFELSGIKPGNPPVTLRYEIRYEPYRGRANHVGYFHATYRDHPNPEFGQDMVLLDTQGAEGRDVWSGSFVGTSFIFSHRAILNTLEGDPRFFFDDSQTPQAQGTGTEEWGGGGDYWGGLNMTLPFAGHPCGVSRPRLAKSPEDLIQSAYRFLLADLMPFGRRAVIRLEHGGVNTSSEHYETVAYWYGLPSPALIETDMLDVGNLKSEGAHRYDSPQASAPESITSRYEWGVDSLPGSASKTPLSYPAAYTDFEFQADAGKPYFIWARGRALSKDIQTGSFWIQFDDAIKTDILNPGSQSPSGMGNWADQYVDAPTWSSARPQDPPISITFDRSGVHRVRIQPSDTPFAVNRLWLSATQSTRPPADKIPTPSEETAGSIDEIVLTTADMTRILGQVELVDDATSATAKTILFKDHSDSIVYPEHAEDGRRTRGVSEFTVRLRPDNQGALLRRTLDYAYPNQRAEVYVADAGDGRSGAALTWESAGVWYAAGSNTCVYSNPKGELDARQPKMQTSNRRFRDDEFLLDRKLTAGRSAIRVRVKFAPVDRPLYPGQPFPTESAWSELRYRVYCWVLPEFNPAQTSP